MNYAILWLLLKKGVKKMANITDEILSKPWEKEGWVTMTDELHELHGVTPEQIDWWWDNMEKGYALWHPIDHHDFKWEEGKSPGEIGHLGAVQIADQTRGPGVPRTGGKTATWMDLDVLPFVPEYDHVLILGGFQTDGENTDYGIHQYEATDYGTKHRWTVILKGPRAESIKAMRESGKTPPKQAPLWNGMTHSQAEAYFWTQFLPTLWKLWQEVKDPIVNPQPNLKVQKLPNGKVAYIHPNLPPK
jgi:hypothetical protein